METTTQDNTQEEPVMDDTPTTPVEEISEAQALAEDTVAQPAQDADEDSADVLDQIQPRRGDTTRTIGIGDNAREYVQRQLTFFTKIEFFSLAGDVMDKALSGENKMSVGHLFDTPEGFGEEGMSAETFKEADTFLQAVSKLVKYAPEFLQDSFCIWLNIPEHERFWAKEVMQYPAEDGGFSDEVSIDIIEVFIDQNWVALEDFFRKDLPRIRKRAQARQAESKSDRSKPSRPTQQSTENE